jgi:zinc transport system permease protein
MAPQSLIMSTLITITMVLADLIFSPFFQRALAAGLILGVIMALLGVLVVLRRLAFFSDALGHSALTGIAIGILFNFNPFFAAFAFSLVVAGTISVARFRSRLQIDTLLGVAFPTAMALGVILVQLSPGYQTDLLAFLFGDILAVTSTDVYSSLILAAIVLSVLYVIGKKMVAISFDEALARAEGVRVAIYETIFLIMLAGTIALAIKLVGIILVTALLVIPAATAHNLSRNLASMFFISVLINLLAITAGLIFSALLNIPSGPTIILSLAALFLLSSILHLIFRPS